jgi:hypothetical protein
MLLLLHDCTGFFTGMYVLHEEGWKFVLWAR